MHTHYQKPKLQSVPRLIRVDMQDAEHTKFRRALHKHKDRVEIRLIRRGSGTYIVDGHFYEVKKGDIIIFSPEILHDESATDLVGLETIGCSIENIQIDGLPAGWIMETDCIPVLHGSWCAQEVEMLLIMIYEAHMELHKNSKEIIPHLLSALVLLLYQASCENEKIIQDKTYNIGSRIRAYIDENYLDDITVPSICAELGMSESYLLHTFKKAVGYSVKQYIIWRRLGDAQTDLLLTNDSIAEIAARAGYNSTSNFQHSFRKAMGMTPQKYRKHLKERT